MDKTSFIIKDISIQKMPGFPRGIESLTNLSDRINIIAGPNASGKSSIARMIQKIIWRQVTEGLQVESSVELDGRPWEIKIDSRNIIVQCDGRNEEMNGLPSLEQAGRYMLALDQLVKNEDTDLARQILNESIGGYDLEAAKGNLGYYSGIPNKLVAQFRNYEIQEENYKVIENRQKELRQQEDYLKELKVSLEHAEESGRLASFYDAVIQYLEARLEFDGKVEQKKTFPDILEAVTGEEFNRIEELDGQLEEIQNSIEKIKNEIDENKQKISGLNLAAGGVDEKILCALEEWVKILSDGERKIQDLNVKIAGIRVKEAGALKGIDVNLKPAEWKNIHLGDVIGLDRFLQEAQGVFSRKKFLDSEIDGLIKQQDKGKFKTEHILAGINNLTYWLQEQTGSAGISKWWLISLPVISLLTVIAIYFFGYVGLAGVLIVIVIFFFALPSTKKNATGIRQEDYDRTGLTKPDEWSTEAVSSKLEELVAMLQEAKWQESIEMKIAGLDADLKEARQKSAQIKKEHEEWLSRIKSVPELPQNDIENYTGLYWFLNRIKDWQVFNTEANALEEEKKILLETCRQKLEQLNNEFLTLGIEKVIDSIGAEIAVRKLKDDERKRIIYFDDIDKQEKFLVETNLQNVNVSRKIKEIYETLSIGDGDKEAVKTLIGKLDFYKKSEEDYGVSKRLLLAKETSIKIHCLYEAKKSEFENLTVDQAKEKRLNFIEESLKVKELTEHIAAIEADIKIQKEGRVLEDALTMRDQALDDLGELYENNLAAISGSLIIDQLKNTIGETNRPRVFKKANELFNRITKYQYELRLDELSSSFLGYDTTSRIGLDLEKLSTGTRIQLLLSVRLAFIETLEGTVGLPILADELLANSDESRAKAIIEALTEISKEGRQVFYFTAQGEEVIRWKNFLDNTKAVNYQIRDIANNKNEKINHNFDADELKYFGLNQITIDPVGRNHEQYGLLLKVPSFNLMTDDPNQLHLWYLLSDNNALYMCLSKGLKLWGNLHSFLKNDGKIPELTEDIINQVQNKVKFLQRFQQIFRQGRSRPIDRQVLENSEAVSGTYISGVSEKLNELKGDPKKLLEALNRGEISGFRTSKIEQLEEYLIEVGYIDNQESLSKEEILIQLHAYLTNIALEPDEANRFIVDILQQGNEQASDVAS